MNTGGTDADENGNDRKREHERDRELADYGCPACTTPSERTRETPSGLGSPTLDPRAEQHPGTAIPDGGGHA